MRDLLDVRPKVAAALAPIADDDPAVLEGLVDSIEPPAIMLAWSDPWLEPMGESPTAFARLEVVCVSGRLEPGAGVDLLESLVEYAMQKLVADPGLWPPATTSAPRAFEIGGVRYLSAGIILRIPVSLGIEGL